MKPAGQSAATSTTRRSACPCSPTLALGVTRDAGNPQLHPPRRGLALVGLALKVLMGLAWG